MSSSANCIPYMYFRIQGHVFTSPNSWWTCAQCCCGVIHSHFMNILVILLWCAWDDKNFLRIWKQLWIETHHLVYHSFSFSLMWLLPSALICLQCCPAWSSTRTSVMCCWHCWQPKVHFKCLPHTLSQWHHQFWHPGPVTTWCASEVLFLWAAATYSWCSNMITQCPDDPSSLDSWLPK